MSRIRFGRSELWTAILIVGILLQMGFLLREYVLPWGWRAKQVWNEPRLVRSADMSLGAQAARIIEYVNQVVPPDATILLPPGQNEARFSLVRSMQYFFFPRHLIACSDISSHLCEDALGSPDVYVLATDDFPPPEATVNRTFVEPDGELGWFKGVYGPSFQHGQAPSSFSWIGTTGVMAKDLAILLGFLILGVLVLLAIVPDWMPLELMAMAIPVGAGCFTWVLFLVSWAGIHLQVASTLVVYGLLLLSVGLVVVRAVPRGKGPAGWLGDMAGRPGATDVLLLGAGVGIAALAVALSIATSYRLYDPAQIWSVKGYGIGFEGSIMAGADWGVHGLAYPLNIPLQVAVFFMIDGDALPGSKFLYPLYGLALCVSVYAFLRRQRVNQPVAGLGSLFLGSVPIVFFHASSGFANLPFTFYLVSGILWAVDGVHSGSIRDQALAGLLLGLAAWTRPEGILYSVAALAVIMVFARMTYPRRAAWAALVAPVIMIAGAWFAFSLAGATLHGSNLQQAVTVYSSDTLAGQIDLSGLWTIVKVFTYSMFVPYRAMFPAISATYWGALFPVVLVLMIWGANRFVWRLNPKGSVLYALLAVVGAINVAVFYIRSYSKSNFPAFIERAFPRAFLPTAVLMTVIALWGLGLRLQERRHEGSQSDISADAGHLSDEAGA
jgi:hypothetical protein